MFMWAYCHYFGFESSTHSGPALAIDVVYKSVDHAGLAYTGFTKHANFKISNL